MIEVIEIGLRRIFRLDDGKPALNYPFATGDLTSRIAECIASVMQSHRWVNSGFFYPL